MNTRELAYCGLFGALALALPTLFHAFGLAGGLFLPMYWPLVTLAFLVPTRRAVCVAALAPWASAVLTGMPLVWPPLAAAMSVELAVQVAAIGLWGRPKATCAGSGTWRIPLTLGVVLVAGRFLHAGLVWCIAQAFPVPAKALAGASFLMGWPGIALMLVFVPVFVGATARRDGVCEVRFLKSLRRLHLPEGVVLVCAQTLRWFEALSRDAEMLARALEMRRGLADAERADAPGGDGCAIRIRNARVTYAGASEPALELASLEVAAGERLALLGPNGCGKTTLLSVLAGYTSATGEIEVLGETPGPTRAFRKIRRRIGILFENPDDQFIFPTVREDVGYASARRGLPQEDVARRVDELLEALGLPTGNRPVAALSRGQRQRVALAGLLAAEPDVLLLDEPTAALDDVERDRLVAVLRRSSATLVVATHDRVFVEALGARSITLSQSEKLST